MKIHLQNFNNLKKLSYEIENKKVNFLFGISGSGKSSISKSINAKDLSNYVMVGQPVESCLVYFEEKEFENEECVPVYDYEYMNNVLIEKSNRNDIYTILYAGEDTLGEYRAKYDEYLAGFKVFKEQLILIKNKISALQRALKIGFNKNGTFKSDCVIRKFEDTITSKGKNTLAYKYSGNRLQWFLDGTTTEEFTDGRCPFCSKKLTERRKEILRDIISIDSKSFERIMKQSPIFHELNIDLPVWNSKTATNNFKQKLHDIIDAESEIDELLQIIDASYKTEFEIHSLKRIKISKKVRELFSELDGAVENFNSSLTEIKKLLGNIKSKTMSLISKNITCINDFLKRFSIPYIFEKSTIDYDNRVAEYVLKHENDVLSVDRAKNLSFGEKNIIGLILFILTNKNRKMLIIDDPASSFDNFRRKVILDLIFETKHPDSTILVLSHDEVFIKLALFYACGAKKKIVTRASMSIAEKKYSSEIGKTTFIENNETTNLIEISMDDFDSFEAFIKKRLCFLPRKINYQTAILIRLLFENKTHKTSREKTAYSYLSAIIHETPYPKIIELLSGISSNEDDVLLEIYKIVGEKYCALDTEYLTNYKTISYSDLEFVALFRDRLSGTQDKQNRAIKTELNSIVHLSSTYITCLDPFKFKMYSYKTHEFLETEKRKWINS